MQIFFKIASAMTFVGTMVYCFFRPIFGDDYWWHVKAGEYMINNQSLPYQDVFSWYGIQEGLYWHSHEWLSEVVFAFFHEHGGHLAVWGFTFCLALLIQGMLYFWNKEAFQRNPIVAWGWMVLGGFCFSIVYTPRPHMISLVFLIYVVMSLIRFAQNPRSRAIYGIPLISLLWANFHGGSSNLPYVLTFMTLIVGCFQFSWGTICFTRLSKQQLQTLLGIGLLSILVIPLNPHGLDMVVYPYANMGDSLMLSVISEWQSPDFAILSGKIAFGLLLICAMIAGMRKQAINGLELAFVGVFAILTVKSIRFAPFLFIAMTGVLFPLVPVLELKQEQRMKLVAFAAIVFAIVFMSLGIQRGEQIESRPIGAPMTEETVQIVKEKQEKGATVFNDYNYGGYLIFHEVEPFIDARADMYSKNILRDAVSLSALSWAGADKPTEQFSAEQLIEAYGFDVFVLPKSRPFATYLAEHEAYRLIADDGMAVVFEKKNE